MRVGDQSESEVGGRRFCLTFCMCLYLSPLYTSGPRLVPTSNLSLSLPLLVPTSNLSLSLSRRATVSPAVCLHLHLYPGPVTVSVSVSHIISNIL